MSQCEGSADSLPPVEFFVSLVTLHLSQVLDP